MASPTKSQLRVDVLRARRAMPQETHDAEAAALCAHLPEFVSTGHVVCAYVPVDGEPGSVELLDVLRRLGARVFLPVTGDDESRVLRWGEYRPGTLVPARFGLLEPPSPLLRPEAIGDAAIVLAPALAVDRTGVRLGRGAGYYDRALLLADRAARLVAVVRDEELVDRLPTEQHDVRMTHALTPAGGLVRVGKPGE